MMVLISGGSGSGKSELAERLITTLSCGKSLKYLATMQPYGDEAHARILRHQAMRKQRNFETVEVYQDLETLRIEEGSNVLLECMSNLLANEMFRAEPSNDVVEKVLHGVERLNSMSENLVIVSNEIFSDGCQYDSSTVEYIKALGTINRRLATLSDCVVECVFGNPIVYKGALPCLG
jgi:adenosylcobinamide kinase/adenosylcobinamide-phosphate guanylyltransferase